MNQTRETNDGALETAEIVCERSLWEKIPESLRRRSTWVCWR